MLFWSNLSGLDRLTWITELADSQIELKLGLSLEKTKRTKNNENEQFEYISWLFNNSHKSKCDRAEQVIQVPAVVRPD